MNPAAPSTFYHPDPHYPIEHIKQMIAVWVQRALEEPGDGTKSVYKEIVTSQLDKWKGALLLAELREKV